MSDKGALLVLLAVNEGQVSDVSSALCTHIEEAARNVCC